MEFYIQLILIASLIFVMTAPSPSQQGYKPSKRPTKLVASAIATIVSFIVFIVIIVNYGYKTDMMTLVTLFVIVMSVNVFRREYRFKKGA